MNNSFIYRVARRAEAGEFAVDAVALQDIALRHRFAADLVGDGALDDRPVDPARAGLLLDIFETAIDDRIEGVQLAFDPLGTAVAATASFPAVAPTAARAVLAAIAIAARAAR